MYNSDFLYEDAYNYIIENFNPFLSDNLFDYFDEDYLMNPYIVSGAYDAVMDLYSYDEEYNEYLSLYEEYYDNLYSNILIENYLVEDAVDELVKAGIPRADAQHMRKDFLQSGKSPSEFLRSYGYKKEADTYRRQHIAHAAENERNIELTKAKNNAIAQAAAAGGSNKQANAAAKAAGATDDDIKRAVTQQAAETKANRMQPHTPSKRYDKKKNSENAAVGRYKASQKKRFKIAKNQEYTTKKGKQINRHNPATKNQTGVVPGGVAAVLKSNGERDKLNTQAIQNGTASPNLRATVANQVGKNNVDNSHVTDRGARIVKNDSKGLISDSEARKTTAEQKKKNKETGNPGASPVKPEKVVAASLKGAEDKKENKNPEINKPSSTLKRKLGRAGFTAAGIAGAGTAITSAAQYSKFNKNKKALYDEYKKNGGTDSEEVWEKKKKNKYRAGVIGGALAGAAGIAGNIAMSVKKKKAVAESLDLFEELVTLDESYYYGYYYTEGYYHALDESYYDDEYDYFC